MLDSSCALIDNDFLNHALEIKESEDKILELISLIFNVLDKTPTIHPWIASYELMSENKLVQKITESVITIATWNDIHGGDEISKRYYCTLFKELHKKIHGEDLSLVGNDVFTHCIRRQNLGELHNITACMFCGCNLILSDDEDSKRFKKIIQQTTTCNFNVYTRQEVAEIIRGRDGSPGRKALRVFAHKA